MQLVILMCKARSCRPCKMFTRKFQRMAERFAEVVCLEIMGDESNDTRKMMMSMQIRVRGCHEALAAPACLGRQQKARQAQCCESVVAFGMFGAQAAHAFGYAHRLPCRWAGEACALGNLTSCSLRHSNAHRLAPAAAPQVTPTFRLYREGSVDDLTGTNEKKLLRAILAHLSPLEQAAHAEEMEAMLEAAADEEEQH